MISVNVATGSGLNRGLLGGGGNTGAATERDSGPLPSLHVLVGRWRRHNSAHIVLICTVDSLLFRYLYSGFVAVRMMPFTGEMVRARHPCSGKQKGC